MLVVDTRQPIPKGYVFPRLGTTLYVIDSDGKRHLAILDSRVLDHMGGQFIIEHHFSCASCCKRRNRSRVWIAERTTPLSMNVIAKWRWA